MAKKAKDSAVSSGGTLISSHSSAFRFITIQQHNRMCIPRITVFHEQKKFTLKPTDESAHLHEHFNFEQVEQVA